MNQMAPDRRPLRTLAPSLGLAALLHLAAPPAAAQPPDYPPSRARSSARVWIERVRFDDTRSASDRGGTGYQDRTHVTIPLVSGSQTYFSVHPHHAGNAELPLSWRVWMDLDADGDFDDVVASQPELVTESPNAGGGSAFKGMFQKYFIVPEGFDGLETRMRVTMAEKQGEGSVAPGPAGTFASGEVEDYTVRLLAMPEAPAKPPGNARIFELAPTMARIQWDAAPGATSYHLRYREIAEEGAWIARRSTGPSRAHEAAADRDETAEEDSWLELDTFFHAPRASSRALALLTLRADTPYAAQLRSVNAGGASEWGPTVAFTTPTAAGPSERFPTVGLHSRGAPFTLAGEEGEQSWTMWDPFVLFDEDEGRYEVWYTVWGGHEPAFYGNRVMGVGHAWSEDGIHWTRQPGGHVLLPTPGSWDKDGLETVSVVKHEGTYYLWYLGKAYGPWLHQLGLATSRDGRTWTKHPANPVLSPEQPFEGDTVKEPSVLWDAEEGLFKMWYNGMRSTERVVRIGYATSLDGVAWTKHRGPVNGEAAAGWNHVHVAKVPGEGRGYLLHALVNYSVLQFWSPDGLTGWQASPNNPVLRARAIGHTWNGAKHDFENILAYGSPSALFRNGRLELYHMRSWFYATEYGDRGMRFGFATGPPGAPSAVETPEPAARMRIHLPIAWRGAE